MHIDAFGKQCPLPLVLAKKQIDEGTRSFTVAVDNETAVGNLTRLGEKTGIPIEVTDIDGGFLVSFSGGEGESGSAEAASEAAPPIAAASVAGSGYAVFVATEFLGAGDDELGANLMKMALFTLSEMETPPEAVLFMNGGVKLLVDEGSQTVESARKLEERGCRVLVCGACLDFFGVKEKLAAGSVSNMYEILETMQSSAKVIRL